MWDARRVSKYKFTEFLSAQQLKAYMSKTGTDLREQLEVRKEREERNAEKKRVKEEAQIALMEDPIKCWATQSYDTVLALDDKLEEFELDIYSSLSVGRYILILACQ